jgi:hypothetical protein
VISAAVLLMPVSQHTVHLSLVFGRMAAAASRLTSFQASVARSA